MAVDLLAMQDLCVSCRKLRCGSIVCRGGGSVCCLQGAQASFQCVFDRPFSAGEPALGRPGEVLGSSMSEPASKQVQIRRLGAEVPAAALRANFHASDRFT